MTQTRNIRDLPMFVSVPAGAVFAVQGEDGVTGQMPLNDLIIEGLPGEPGAVGPGLFNLQPVANVVVGANEILGVGVTGGFSCLAASVESFSGDVGVSAKFNVGDGLNLGAIGLNTAPITVPVPDFGFEAGLYWFRDVNRLLAAFRVHGTQSYAFIDTGYTCTNNTVGRIERRGGRYYFYADGQRLLAAENFVADVNVPLFLVSNTIINGKFSKITFGPIGEPGTNGIDGVDGTDGIFREFVWRRAAAKPARPAGNGIPANWFDDPPAGTDPLWISVARQELNGVLIAGEIWSDPIRHDGPAGTNGINGQPGTNGLSATLNPPSLPVACFANGVVKPDAFTGLSAQFEIFSGAALQSAGWTFSIVSELSVAASGTVSAAGVVRPTAVSDDDAYLVVRAINGAIVIDRSLRLPKVRDGGSGVSKSVNITTLPTSGTFVEVAQIEVEIPPQISISISAGAGYLTNGAGSYTPNMKLMLQDVTAGSAAFDVAGTNVFGSTASNTGGIEPEFFDGSVSASAVVANASTAPKIMRLIVMVRRSGGGQSVAVTFGRATISAGG